MASNSTWPSVYGTAQALLGGGIIPSIGTSRKLSFLPYLLNLLFNKRLLSSLDSFISINLRVTINDKLLLPNYTAVIMEICLILDVFHTWFLNDGTSSPTTCWLQHPSQPTINILKPISSGNAWTNFIKLHCHLYSPTLLLFQLNSSTQQF